MRRWIALGLIALLAAGSALAETDAPQPTGLLPGESLAPQTAMMPPEEARLLVGALFAAATGTDTEAERLARKDLTKEEITLRNAQLADYRARTLPWLAEALRPEEELMAETDAVPSQTPSPSPSPTPTPTPSPAPSAEAGIGTAEPPVYTAADGYAAFAGTLQGMAYLEMLASLGAEDAEGAMEITKRAVAQWMAEVDHERLAALNEDYAGWIYAPGTQIDYPIVHGEDNSYYLKRLFSGEKNSAGTLFIDYRNLGDFQDPNTLIYGHHMRNDSMFGTLTDYVDQAYFESHPLMLMMNAEEIFLLELFAGYTTSDQDHCYDIAISDENDMAEFIKEAQRKSDFTSGVQVNAADRLVTLSTCAYVFEDARYILIGRIIPVWNEEIRASIWSENGKDSNYADCPENLSGQSE